jgi:hypothetical protein
MTEDKLGQKMLEFERSQTKIIRTTGNELLIGKPMRPTLPCDMEEPRTSRTDTGAFTPILRALEKHGPMTSRDLARLLKKNSHNVCGTVRHAVTAGLVDQTPHSIPRDEDDKTNGHMDCWLYHLAA